MKFDQLLDRLPWRPLRGCHGRWVLSPEVEAGPPERLWPAAAPERYRSPAAPDEIYLTRFDDGGGLLSYRKPNGRFLHTLNSPDGLARKLERLGIEPSATAGAAVAAGAGDRRGNSEGGTEV